MTEPDKYEDMFLGGLTEEGHQRAQQFRAILEALGYSLVEGTIIPTDIVMNALTTVGITSALFQAFAAPSFLNSASDGLEAQWEIGDDDEMPFYQLVNPQQP